MQVKTIKTKIKEVNDSVSNEDIERNDKTNNNLERFNYNVIIASMYETYNFLNQKINSTINSDLLLENYKKILSILYPIIPHFVSECLEDLKIDLNIKSFIFETYDVYNFPNPFKKDTYFTFKTSTYPTIAKIKIFNLNGDHIQTLDQNCESSFCSIYWNGKNKENNFINNGTYIYNLSLKNDDMKYNNLYKLTKLK